MNTKTLHDWLPPITLRAIRRLASELRFVRFGRKDALYENIELKGQGRSRRAFLLATGPSLKLEDLTLLAGEDCFSLSNFFLHKDLGVARPKYHFFAPYHKPLILENYIDWLREADSKLPTETGIFLGHCGLPLVEEYNLFLNRKVCYLYFSEAASRKGVDLTRPVLTPQTGTIMILPVLFYMGYSEIYLLGCDHTVLRDYGGVVKNFYSENLDPRTNATNGKCWTDIVRAHQSSMNVFIQYEFYKNLMDDQEVNIWNLSKDSWLASFPFKKLEDVVS